MGQVLRCQVMIVIFPIFADLVQCTLPGVRHGGRHTGMPQRFGDDANVPAAHDQRLGKGVTQPVRRQLAQLRRLRAAGEAFAAGWLERERGAWIQSPTSSFAFRRTLVQELAALTVRAMGFGDRGRVIM